MRKEITSEATGQAAAEGIAWLDINTIAKAQVSSEDSCCDGRPTRAKLSARSSVRNFSPPNSIRGTEDYSVQIHGVTILELAILPDQNGGDARASILQWRIA